MTRAHDPDALPAAVGDFPADEVRPSDAVTGAGQRRRGLNARLSALPAWQLLTPICAASALVVVVLGTRLTFFNDDWYFLLQRPGLESHGGADVLLAPHNGNLSVLLTLAYKLLVGGFGLHAQLPFRLLLGAAVAATGVFVYLLVSVRVGRLFGLIAAVLVMLLGPAWEDLLFFAAINHIGAVAAGLAALYALEGDTPRRNIAACMLLTGSILLANTGLAFVAGAALGVVLRARPKQLWIVLIPASLFAVWWASYGTEGPSYVSASNIVHLPRYVLQSLSTGLASASGLYNGLAATYARGHGLLLLAALGVAWLVRRRGRPAAGLLVFAGTALAFWVLTGASFIPGREPLASRYQLIDAILLILIAAELLREVRLGTKTTAVVLLAALAVVGLNLRRLSLGFSFMREHAGYVKADLGALELARAVAPPGMWLIADVARDPFLSGVTAGRYFAVTREHGSPSVYSPAQIATAPEGQRQAADSVLASAYSVGPRTLPPRAVASPERTPGCTRLAVSAHHGTNELELRAGGARITDTGAVPLFVGVRRFAPHGLPVYVGIVAAHTSARIAIREDRVALPWHLAVLDASPVATALVVCRA